MRVPSVQLNVHLGMPVPNMPSALGIKEAYEASSSVAFDFDRGKMVDPVDSVGLVLEPAPLGVRRTGQYVPVVVRQVPLAVFELVHRVDRLSPAESSG